MSLKLVDLLDYTDDMAHKWDFIGIKLGQEKYVKQIRDDSMPFETRLTRIFDKWMEAPPENLPVEWSTIVKVLKSVKLITLAGKIEKVRTCFCVLSR